jgi:hypothetical protein
VPNGMAPQTVRHEASGTRQFTLSRHDPSSNIHPTSLLQSPLVIRQHVAFADNKGSFYTPTQETNIDYFPKSDKSINLTQVFLFYWKQQTLLVYFTMLSESSVAEWQTN